MAYDLKNLVLTQDILCQIYRQRPRLAKLLISLKKAKPTADVLKLISGEYFIYDVTATLVCYAVYTKDANKIFIQLIKSGFKLCESCFRLTPKCEMVKFRGRVRCAACLRHAVSSKVEREYEGVEIEKPSLLQSSWPDNWY
jgi:hypothetical protein